METIHNEENLICVKRFALFLWCTEYRSNLKEQKNSLDILSTSIENTNQGQQQNDQEPIIEKIIQNPSEIVIFTTKDLDIIRMAQNNPNLVIEKQTLPNVQKALENVKKSITAKSHFIFEEQALEDIKKVLVNALLNFRLLCNPS